MDYINKADLLLALAELPIDDSKREMLQVVYDMPAEYLVEKTEVSERSFLPYSLYSNPYQVRTVLTEVKKKKEGHK